MGSARCLTRIFSPRTPKALDHAARESFRAIADGGGPTDPDAIIELGSKRKCRNGEFRKRKRQTPSRLPSRLLPFVKDVAKGILERHATLDYHRLLNRHCPLPPCACRGRVGDGGRPRPGARKLLCGFAVTAYLKACVQRLLPRETLGSKHNWRRLLDCLGRFVQLRSGFLDIRWCKDFR